MKRILPAIIACLLLGLAACDKPPPPLEEGEASPALWEVRSAGGTVEGWLFGTVHALPDGTSWRTSRLDKVIRASDALVVEVANLSDDAAMAGLFNSLAYDEPPSPVRNRISPALRKRFDRILAKAGTASASLDRMESWAAALALAQMAQDGEQENGVDLYLLDVFDGRTIVELEGAARQLATFDSLPEKEQRDLLDAVVVEASSADSDQDMVASWARGDVEQLGIATKQGILADPELREALLDGRNREWASRLTRILAADEKPLVAVGAGHLVGPTGLPALLEMQGYTVVRVE